MSQSTPASRKLFEKLFKKAEDGFRQQYENALKRKEEKEKQERKEKEKRNEDTN